MSIDPRELMKKPPAAPAPQEEEEEEEEVNYQVGSLRPFPLVVNRWSW